MKITARLRRTLMVTAAVVLVTGTSGITSVLLSQRAHAANANTGLPSISLATTAANSWV